MNANDRKSLKNTKTLLLISQYVSAIQNRDGERMKGMRSPEFGLDLVAGDAFNDNALTEAEARRFWPTWFSAFSESDYQVTRTISAETVVVTEWQFTGTNTGKLESAIFGREVEATHKTIRFRGVSVYDVEDEFIVRETLYMDLATLWVELGVGS
ncbi:MAG: ester cyclase [Proteobacteria bacterium]|nr:ester cyclase [Pseudomonadota bacterium]